MPQQLGHEDSADAGEAGLVVGEAGAPGVGFEPVDDLCHVAAFVASPRVAQQRWLVDLQYLAVNDAAPAGLGLGEEPEKTVFNYFPTKESLILDRLESTMASLKSGLAQPGVAAEAALRILDDELSAMTSWLTRQDDLTQASAAIRRFGTLIQASPSLRAHQSDMMDQFVAVAAEILTGRAA